MNGQFLWGKLVKMFCFFKQQDEISGHASLYFKEATTAFVHKCCKRKHRIKGACMCINQLIQSFIKWLEGYIPKNPRCPDLLLVTHDLDIVFAARPGNKDPDLNLNNLISSQEPKNIQWHAKMKIQTENTFSFVVLTERMNPLISEENESI